MNFFDDSYRGKRVLITGHTGFKGSWLALWLHSLGAKVAGYSIGLPSVPTNFELLGLESHIKHYLGDIRDRARLGQVIDEFQPEVIFHLAAQALVREAHADPAGTFETNVMGMVNLLELIRQRTWIEAAVLVTSDKAYRNVEWFWGYRENDPLGGDDPYSSSKSCADLVAQSYCQSFLHDSPTQIAITRAGNVIGGGDWANDRIVPDCIRAWNSAESVTVRSPEATRPWQHVLEPLSGYLWLGALLLRRCPQLDGEAFNFGPNASVNQTVAQLLNAMRDRWPSASWKTPDGHESAGKEAMLLKLSCDKALSLLNWSATLGFEETVEFTVDWYRAWQTNEDDLLQFTLGQINKYCQLAAVKEASWIQS